MRMNEHVKYVERQIRQVWGEKEKLERKMECSEQLGQKSPYLVLSMKRPSEMSGVQCFPLQNNTENKLIGSLMSDKQKRHRRRATLIDRHYQCPLQTCSKNYGSEGSLNQHMKLKHPEV
jgi:hypothetical protein